MSDEFRILNNKHLRVTNKAYARGTRHSFLHNATAAPCMVVARIGLQSAQA
jgi:hypothetical protein